ncbi:hypothetical protein Glove_168g11 [Diversispora epigaea]|uniref:Uncharacterized protein n=1 Tax=Diversispora epigaea TaxID=1348612 RepID=A0A397IZ78_9GLOM|nr:hypothetical protein Glove_168g11 [Diversispora epigaea]
MIDQVVIAATIVDAEIIDDTMMIGDVVSIVVTEIIVAVANVMADDAVTVVAGNDRFQQITHWH